ncbi:hypothetical protein RF11_05215 [Thelohanellus kitauei]|uniref:Chromosome segregation in meiosis protein 3 domain-containing protein n=1 Tax=Thelohanellus kitauei TaxID=669202 RepID=A0A0C2IB57_THEKT|nr:hypothetical protein RF11_05215 [Thelohanellus kitauei]
MSQKHDANTDEEIEFIKGVAKYADSSKLDAPSEHTLLKPKKKTKPRFKINDELLKTENGIKKLKSMVDKLQFNPNSTSQKQNLNTLMTTFELWAHELCPEHLFQDVCRKLDLIPYSRVRHHITDENEHPRIVDAEKEEIQPETEVIEEKLEDQINISEYPTVDDNDEDIIYLSKRYK